MSDEFPWHAVSRSVDWQTFVERFESRSVVSLINSAMCLTEMPSFHDYVTQRNALHCNSFPFDKNVAKKVGKAYGSEIPAELQVRKSLRRGGGIVVHGVTE